MAITPADIQAQTFSEAKRGYDPAEVDVFLETLSSEVDAMLAKIVDLKGRLTATEQQLADTQAQLAQAVHACHEASSSHNFPFAGAMVRTSPRRVICPLPRRRSRRVLCRRGTSGRS